MQKKLELRSVPLVVAGVVLALMGQAQSADSPPPQAAQNPAVQSPAAPASATVSSKGFLPRGGTAEVGADRARDRSALRRFD